MREHERQLEMVEGQQKRILDVARRQAKTLDAQRQSLTKQIELERAR